MIPLDIESASVGAAVGAALMAVIFWGTRAWEEFMSADVFELPEEAPAKADPFWGESELTIDEVKAILDKGPGLTFVPNTIGYPLAERLQSGRDAHQGVAGPPPARYLSHGEALQLLMSGHPLDLGELAKIGKALQQPVACEVAESFKPLALVPVALVSPACPLPQARDAHGRFVKRA